MFLLVSVRHVGAHPYELQHGVSIQRSINLGKTLPRVSRIRFTPSTQMLGRVFVYLPPFIYQILEFICRMVLDGVRLKTRSGLKTTLVKFTYHKGYTGRFPHCSINILSWSRLILMTSSYNCHTSQSPFDTFWWPFASACPYPVSCSETVCPYGNTSGMRKTSHYDGVTNILQGIFKKRGLPLVRECVLEPGNFCLWNPDYVKRLLMESAILGLISEYSSRNAESLER